MLRLSDETETALNLARPTEVGGGGSAGGCLAIVGYEGPAEDVRRRRDRATRVLAAAGATRRAGRRRELGSTAATGAPYLRDALLDAGALVETLETVTFWS